MKRQAVAVFVAVVAVGIGPAIWLGSTLFRAEPAPATQLPADVPATLEAPVEAPEEEPLPVEPEETPEPVEEPGEADLPEDIDEYPLDPDGVWTPGANMGGPPPVRTEPSTQHPPAVG